ncbi:EAL domain-containing protein [Craterilacuibacter sinensis]|uniref:cyclic-guanylate-specific phosphodiesterase n=1 Tax=Craterilacuibacter sinensis TaxID=2686017 RepID=A0A845BLY3_9NEIS|nr:EAL domain-containing protein [Craterilacuibacter sinensis]MXR36410.1 EAL domain-containing protein [Craterilacuibacter sinensis]
MTPLNDPRVASRPRRLLLVLLVVLLPALLGWGITLVSIYLSMQSRLEGVVGGAHDAVTLVFKSADATASEALLLVGQPCQGKTLRLLRELTTRALYVRTVNLGSGEHYYCSSLYGALSKETELSGYAGGRTKLRLGSQLTPGGGVLAYRALAADGSFAVVGISGGHLRTALRQGGLSDGMSLQIGDKWMDSEGGVHSGTPPRSLLLETRRQHAIYPFTIVAAVYWPAFLAESRVSYQPMLILLLLLGSWAGWFYYQWLQQPRPASEVIAAAAERQEFIPFLQPLFDARSGRLMGAEVLLRWQHPRDGLLSPFAFIEAVEKSGQMGRITRQLMQDVTTALAPQAARLPDGFHLAFNLDAGQLDDPCLLDDCRRLMAAFPADKLVLTLELTEREAFGSDGHFEVFSALQAQGIQLAIDDFGTGQSSLAYLHQLAIDTLKIDRAFVDAIGRDSLGKVVLDAIIALGKQLNLKLVAEGVETEAQRDYLVAAGVDFLQGYLLARPMPLAGFIAQLPE